MPEPGEENKGGEGLEALQSQLNQLKVEAVTLKAAKVDLETKLSKADDELLSPEYVEFLASKKEGKAAPAKAEGKVNFDEMTPAQIAEHLENTHKGHLDSAIKDITTKMNTIYDSIDTLAASVDLNLAVVKHKDFGDALATKPEQRSEEQKVLVDTSFKFAKENPKWGAERCYKAAVAEIKVNALEKAEAEKIKADKENKAITEKGGMSAPSVQGKQLARDDAADRAWKAAFGNADKVT